MNKELFSQVCQALFMVCTTGVLYAEELSAEVTNEDAKLEISSDSSYFFYQQSEYPRDCDEVYARCSTNGNSSGVYYIRPQGYPEPFEVYCENSKESGGWTVIQNRHENGSIEFRRNWDSYKEGFGFLSHDYWIGSEKLSFLTNQKEYELLIEMTTSNGTVIAVAFNNFRIGDEHSDYKLISLVQNYFENAQISWGQSGLYYGNCTCGQRTCEEPETCINTCVEGKWVFFVPCPDGFYMKGEDCVPQRECGCYAEEDRIVVPEGGFYMSLDCTRKSSCSNGEITLERFDPCSANAVCSERYDSRHCTCNEGYTGDGRTCLYSVTVKDCQDLYDGGIRTNGVYTIKPSNWDDPAGFDVYCNMTDGGGWTVFQRRIDGTTDFFLDWASYKEGFGNLTKEFWLGNDKLHSLTNQRSYQMRIDFANTNGSLYYAKYTSFLINNEADKYRLVLGTCSGSATYDALGPHRNQPFSTKDRDNDPDTNWNCAVTYNGAWWYFYVSYHYYCVYSNLNGIFRGSSGFSSVSWHNFLGALTTSSSLK